MSLPVHWGCFIASRWKTEQFFGRTNSQEWDITMCPSPWKTSRSNSWKKWRKVPVSMDYANTNSWLVRFAFTGNCPPAESKHAQRRRDSHHFHYLSRAAVSL